MKCNTSCDNFFQFPIDKFCVTLQSVAKLFEHLGFFSGLIVNFNHLMLVIKSIKPKDRSLININFRKLN